ncbi:MAG: hypothetical protein C3F17_05695 [Bradyrhizobiaceae bacterium]|nr:MAG: hypothetical protein C3F17_05695 [Bradyrhizobiaceae bacterium]
MQGTGMLRFRPQQAAVEPFGFRQPSLLVGRDRGFELLLRGGRTWTWGLTRHAGVAGLRQRHL